MNARQDSNSARRTFYARYGKRMIDVAAVIVTLPLTLPLIALTALAVRTLLGKPILHLAQRPGMSGRAFTLYKFRSMTDARGADGELLPDSERMTRFGKLLRASSLDELPGLWNVFIGDMSIVGPRPLLMQYLPLYNADEARRHEVRPGVTGLAQVNGRNALSWDSKFAYDVQYVDDLTLWLDLKILARTVWIVATSRGVSAEGEATMVAFTGSKKSTPGRAAKTKNRNG